jgi:hypothetical protein
MDLIGFPATVDMPRMDEAPPEMTPLRSAPRRISVGIFSVKREFRAVFR